VPRSPHDLRRRIPLLEGVDYTLSTTSQSLLALLTAAPALQAEHGHYVDNIKRYYDHIAANDLRVVECITDAKGDRSLPPSKQAEPDAYVHVVEPRDDGVVVRGAKLHITGAPLAHELVVMPTFRHQPAVGRRPVRAAAGDPPALQPGGGKARGAARRRRGAGRARHRLTRGGRPGRLRSRAGQPRWHQAACARRALRRPTYFVLVRNHEEGRVERSRMRGEGSDEWRREDLPPCRAAQRGCPRRRAGGAATHGTVRVSSGDFSDIRRIVRGLRRLT
jgi:hypothetical protein